MAKPSRSKLGDSGNLRASEMATGRARNSPVRLVASAWLTDMSTRGFSSDGTMNVSRASMVGGDALDMCHSWSAAQCRDAENNGSSGETLYGIFVPSYPCSHGTIHFRHALL